ncbi:MAG: 50S ribosomal protein L13 [Candidatus Buchananbacteria bacterium RIFCSPHIGHO2_01_FULL_44_11]|uniref:Large ribosomal subunit protein uL13 n=1 Tax=Candidatus Buchananbacteria bacterium RIFCSPHIGHO2_01_FULL_44_11 TaxID=1797535 RepID=A0A1G1Y2A7_9BACT|nr:MAG: 50S ribosomal protein L13 [Candidatus Buchananbacteria bacterium RIFCSPHIGHO2_01_FULL_44_11]
MIKLKNKTKKISKKPVINRQHHKIDATNLAVGRLATQVASLLRGKTRPDFLPHVDMGDNVLVENIKNLKFTGRKLGQKVYYHHTSYPGGLKTQKLNELFAKNPAEVLKKAVWNMLPKNKLRDKMIKRLTIKK